MHLVLFVFVAGVVLVGFGATHFLNGRRSKGLMLLVIGVLLVAFSWYEMREWNAIMRRVWEMRPGATRPVSD